LKGSNGLQQNWSQTWKTIVIVNQFIFTFITIMTPLAIAPLTLIFEAEFDRSLPEVNMLFGAAAIVLGYANFLIVPAANVFGRRPVLIICGLICILANVWQGLVTSYPSFIGARVISGLGAAANESLMPMVAADILFLHQRGRSMTLYLYVLPHCLPSGTGQAWS
jgi:MFS family permease